VNTTLPQGSTLGPLEDLGWTALSVSVALVLLPAIGLKALGGAFFPKTPKTEERHYLIQ
jgi:hypothetical protein